MRILSLHLRNYRGIQDRRVEFPREGVTVLEGPNEAGKSSLAEAIDLVFNALDTTTSRRWTAIRPVDRDAGTEVEIEVEVGDYRFTYQKRFFKRRGTQLSITQPRPEQLSGREAHERARAILEQHIDYDLWDALQVHQGTGVAQPDGLDRAESLVKALGRSAGGESGGEGELDLYEAVRAECAKYFTEDRRQPRKPLQQAHERVERAAGNVKRCQEELERLERDVERVGELDRQLVELEAQREKAEQSARQREAELRALDTQATELAKLELACKAAGLEESAARKRRSERMDQIARLKAAGRERRQVEAQAVRDEPAFTDLEQRLRQGRERRDAAEARMRDAGALLQLRDKDVSFRDGELDLAQLTERRDRIREAQAQAEAARALLEETRVDDAVLKQIRELSFALGRAQAQLDAGSPQLKVTAAAQVETEVDGEPMTLAPGESVERTVAARSTVRVANLIEVEVTAGTSVDELVRARDRARGQLGALLAQAGVEDLEQAEARNEKRREALRVLEQTERSIGQDLRDLDLAKLSSKVESMRRYVDRYPTERPPEPTIASDYDSAVATKREAKRVLELAQAEAEEARSGFSATDEAWQEMRRRIAETRTRVQMAVETERQAAAALRAACAGSDDEQVERSLRLAAERRDAAERAYAAAKQEYESHEPDRLKELAENARRAAASAAVRLSRAHEERHTLAGRLDARGEDGLYERREEALTGLRHAELEQKAVDRKAAAAKLLFETMRRAREEAQRSYVGPLRDRILELGRVVFGSSFDVELDEELRIATRTLDGVTLPFRSLSMGAQEQLALLERVACALTVDPDDGAPLIFDDTLGYSDPERLEAMGAVLSKAGEKCQIIVLTCTPDRFRHVGAASIVRLA